MARPCCGLGTARRARFASRPSPASGLERSTADGADLPLARRRRNVARASRMAAAVCSRLRSREGLSTIPFRRPVGSLRRSQGHSRQIEQSRADVRVRSRRALPPCSAPERRPVRAARCQLGSPFGSPLLPIEAPGQVHSLTPLDLAVRPTRGNRRKKREDNSLSCAQYEYGQEVSSMIKMNQEGEGCRTFPRAARRSD